MRREGGSGLAASKRMRHDVAMTLYASTCLAVASACRAPTLAAFQMGLVFCFSLLAFGCGQDAGREPDATEPEATPVVDAGVLVLAPPAECGADFPGPPPADIADLRPNYIEDAEAALASSSVIYPVDLSAAPAFQRATVNYLLGRASGQSVAESDVEAAGELGEAVKVAIAAGGGSEVDFIMLRRGLAHYYHCARPLPASLDELVEVFGDFTTWEARYEIGCSRAKNEARQIYEHPEGALFVAETVDEDGAIRETEVLFRSTRDDGHLDFAAYTQEGLITNRSSFATPSSTLVLAAPYTCLTCHVDMEAEQMNIVDATGTGAGCQ